MCIDRLWSITSIAGVVGSISRRSQPSANDNHFFILKSATSLISKGVWVISRIVAFCSYIIRYNEERSLEMSLSLYVNREGQNSTGCIELFLF